MRICNLTANFAGSPATTGPAPAPEAAEPRKAKAAGLSIKAMMAEAEHKPARKEPQVAEPAAAARPLDSASLKEAWEGLVQSESKMPRLSSALAQAEPYLEGAEVHFEVGNSAQKEWIDRNCRSRLEAFLQRHTGTQDLKLVVEVKKAEEISRGMYMPSEKAKYLQENSDEYNALKKDFELEVN